MKNVFLTGASSGIGLQLTLQLAARGERLGLLALPGEDLNQAADKARAAGAAHVQVFGADVRDRAAVRQAIQEFAEAMGGLDVIIGCAGVDFEIPLDDFRSDRAELIYAVNLSGLMFGANAALELMLKQGYGHIVGFASMAGWRIFPVHADYSASKSAVIAYLESLRVRLRGRPITITTVSPGFVRTPMTADNRFPIPFQLEAGEAARIVLRGIDRRKNQIAFPFPVTAGVWFLRALPDFVWNFLARFIK